MYRLLPQKSTRGRRGRPIPRDSPGKHGPTGALGPQGPKGDPRKPVLAPSLVAPPMSMVVNESGTATFQCEADGNPEPEVTWLKQNSSLPADKRVRRSDDN